MNAYYENNSKYNSNNDIFETYFNIGATASKTRKAADACLAALSALIAFLTGLRVRILVRTLTFSVCLVGFIGIIGAMERGTLGLGAGLLIGALLVGAEFLCLRRR